MSERDKVEQACRNCMFWFYPDKFADGEDYFGDCRRFPPRSSKLCEDNLWAIEEQLHTDQDYWCGEWKDGGEDQVVAAIERKGKQNGAH